MLLLRSEGQHTRQLWQQTPRHAHLARRRHGRQRVARQAQLAALGPLHVGGGAAAERLTLLVGRTPCTGWERRARDLRRKPRRAARAAALGS